MPGLLTRRKAPAIATTLGVLEIVLGIIVGVLGLLVIALVNLMRDFSGEDRSFYAGTDANYLLLGVLDFGVAVLLIAGAIGLMTGRMSGRLGCTVGDWAVIGFGLYWLGETTAPIAVPVTMMLAAVGLLIPLYLPSMGRWLGVRPPPQPE